MKHSTAQLYFVGGVFFWSGVLQGVMLWYLGSSNSLVCNASGAWPLSFIPFLGGSILTAVLTGALALWAWKTLKNKEWESKQSRCLALCWSLLVATGLSHSVERLSSQCVLDYWQLTLAGKTIYFNLGDVSLTLSVILFAAFFLWEKRSNHL